MSSILFCAAPRAYAITADDLVNIISLLDKFKNLSNQQVRNALVIGNKIIIENKTVPNILSNEQKKLLNNLGLTNDQIVDAYQTVKDMLDTDQEIDQLQQGDLIYLAGFFNQVVDKFDPELIDTLASKGLSVPDAISAALRVVDLTFDPFGQIPEEELNQIFDEESPIAADVAARYGLNWANIEALRQSLTNEEKNQLKDILITLGNYSDTTNADLSGLAVSKGKLDPAFAPGQTQYTVVVSSGDSGIKVTPTTADPKATVKVNGVTVQSGTASANIPLNVGNNTIIITVTAQNGDVKTYTLTVIRPQAVTVTPASPTVNVTAATPVAVTVPEGVSGAKIEATVNASNEATLPLVQVQAVTSLGVVAVQIPDDTKVTGPAGWDGTIELPTVKANDSVSVSNGAVSAVVEVGFADAVLTFDKPVRLLIPGMAGKSAAYKRGNGDPVLITRTISADSQAAANDELPAGGDGKIDVGSDLAIWTKHFTQFIAYTPTGGGGGGGGGGSAPAPPPAADITVPTDGGTFTTADGQAGLIVPEGTLLQEATIKIVLVTGPIPDPSMTFASNVYEFTSSAAFNGAVTIVLKYDPAKVADPSKLGIYYYNETLKQWVFIGGTVDPVTGTVSVQVDHFTKFAILVNPNKVKLSDIDKHWGYRFINRLVGMGIISGYGDGSFRPDQTISRAEFATIIAKAKGLPLDSQAALTLGDAASIPGWARPAVAAAVKAGIINGYEDNTFRPDRLITRTEMAVMMVRAMNLSPAASPALTFVDAGDIPVWARGYVATAVEKGIIMGRPDNTFGALDSATRAEAATMTVKMLEELGI